MNSTKRLNKIILLLLHIAVMIGAMWLIILISLDAFRNKSFLENPHYFDVQFWICLLFIFDVIADLVLNDKRWNNLLGNVFFFIVSIPYLNIIFQYHITLSPHIQYIISFIPMIRVTYVLSLVLSTISGHKSSNMLASYLSLLIVIVYFSSLVFFVEEHNINPGVSSYWSALWWALMCMTTAGSSIEAITTTGKVLNVILSAGGLILFPVFTVYITNAINPEKGQVHYDK